jgi:hypothetical protein
LFKWRFDGKLRGRSRQLISHNSARISFYVASAFYLVANAFCIWLKPVFRTPLYLTGSAIFFFLYLLPLTLFEAKIEPKPDGLHILQYRPLVVPYADVKICFGFFLIPFRGVVVVTNRKFPVKVLLTVEDIDGPSGFRLFQEGKLVKTVKEFMAAERLRPRPLERQP